jgi:LacI family transcriptional regulator
MRPTTGLPHTDQNGRATLRTVAELAGVSPSTVSRVLHPGAKTAARRAAAATVSRIRQVARDVGYVPNPHAASLRTQRSALIGVVVPRLSDIVLALIYEGIDAAANEHGFGTFVANSHDDPDTQRVKAEMMLNRRVDGLILGDARADGGLVEELRSRDVPYVLTNRHVGDHPAVTCDDEMGGRLVAEHLLETGHTRVAVAAGAPYASTGIDRTAAFVNTFAAAGHPVPDDLVVHAPFDVPSGRRAAELLLSRTPPPTAIFAVNDFAAIGALGAIRDSGRVPGEEIALVGYNDVPLAAELPIPLTTVRSPMHEMGYRAVQMLMQRLDGKPVESERLPPELVVRASTTSWRG